MDQTVCAVRIKVFELYGANCRERGCMRLREGGAQACCQALKRRAATHFPTELRNTETSYCKVLYKRAAKHLPSVQQERVRSTKPPCNPSGACKMRAGIQGGGVTDGGRLQGLR